MNVCFECPDCGHLHQEMRAVLNQNGSGRWLCPKCGHQYGVFSNEGRLDLGLITHGSTTGLSVDFPDGEGPDVEP